MSDLPQPRPTAVEQPEEVVDAVPVATAGTERHLVVRSPRQVIAQSAAVAVTGFAVGALATALVRRSGGSRRALRRPAPTRRGPNVLATRSFLVDVHLLGGSD